MSKKFLVVASYPEMGSTHGKKTVGIASYTKNTLLALKKQDKDLRIVVLAEIHNSPVQYQESGILVKRIWRRGSLIDIFRIFKAVQKEKAEKIIVAFEAYMFGSLFHLPLFLIILGLMKLNNKKIYLILHQIVKDFDAIEENKIKKKLFNWAKTLFYQTLIIISSRVIVFEKEFKKILGNKEKIVTIHHAVEEKKAISKREAREKLGLSKDPTYALYFGYLSPYKGADLLVRYWGEIEDTKLIIAGGGNPNHMKNPKYVNFVKNIFQNARELNIVTPGFIPEKEISLYFSAIDLFILPYQIFISSSGPLSLAFSFEKPVLLSKSLTGYFESHDMKTGLKEAGLKKENILFSFNDNNLIQKLTWIKNKSNFKKLKKFSQIMKEKRNWKLIGKKYLEVLGNN